MPSNIVFTANRRLAQYLRQEHDQQQVQAHKSTWPTLHAYALTDWLHDYWQQHSQTEQILLSQFQEFCIWQEIIEQDSCIIIDSVATTQMALQAWNLLCLWNLQPNSIPQSDNQATQHFRNWAEIFQSKCLEQGWLSQQQLATEVTNLLHQQVEPIADQITLVGFDHLPPAFKSLIEQLEKHSQVTQQDIPQRHNIKQRVELENSDQELTHLAQWAYTCYQQNSSQRIACVIPNLGQIRDQVEQIFTEQFAFDTLLPGLVAAPPPFNISAGKRLDQYQLIDIALRVLELNFNPIHIPQFSHLLQSPYLCCHEQDTYLGAQLDVALRDYGSNSLPLSALFTPLGELLNDYPESTWLRRWQHWSNNLKELPESAKPSEWATHFNQQLKLIGWPGGRTLSSHEFQTLNRWQQLLIEFANLDSLFSMIDIKHAWQLLSNLVTQTLFQPRTDTQPIQILGLLEAVGMDYDQIWIMGLHDGVWPAAAKPNAFLPIALQQQYDMPHSSAQRELEFAQQMTQRLFNAADTVIVSSAALEQDRALRPSTLISHIATTSVEQLIPNQTENELQRQQQSANITAWQDDTAPAITDAELVQGGSNILKLQSACPFRAFATYRLNAISFDEPGIGIAPSERGNLMHKALQRFWLRIQSQQELLQLSDNELHSICQDILTSVIRDACANHLYFTSKRMVELEQQRLMQLMLEWLDIEKQRPKFSVVQRETRRHIQVGDLELHIQIDRIDQISDQQLMIIDYKTGATNVRDWFGERPKDPQLPLYCAYGQDQQYNAITFASLRGGQMQFSGLMQETFGEYDAIQGVIPINQYKPLQPMPKWQQLIKEWQYNLEQLADQFMAGDADVDPADVSVCSYCDLHLLCRINQT